MKATKDYDVHKMI